ncbi:sugar phosphate isomerase/epimerase [Saliphagus infecundisoli]|uniref:Sugar phosphate isomerase/epimerase n=1 Tax=Saliphagus infecundisoli TaxID=1849069 RepID=A0ABD5QAG4_9EURY|nr:sugar phosphate isomerase/epimerase [Saliphagus infecundisoli]
MRSTRHFEWFVEFVNGRFGFEPDVGLAAHAGYDPLDLLAVVSEDAPVVHLTDTVPGDDDGLHADVGEGVVDVETCAKAAVRNGAEWLVCENGRADDGLASLTHGSEAFADLRDGI